MDNSEYLSKKRLEELKEELEDLKTNKRKEVAERLEYAKSLGDLSENSEYDEAQDQQSFLEERILRLEDIIRRAVVIKGHKGDKVGVGSSVKIKKIGSGEIREYKIVGPEEVDVSSGKISNQSPIGAALIGKKKNEEITAMGPNGELRYKIIDIS